MGATGRGWDVLLVGGPAGSGKTTLARRLAALHGVPVTDVDDLFTAVAAMTTPEQRPLLHFWATHPEVAAEWTAEQVLQQHLRVARDLEPAVEAVVADHLEFALPVVLEGDYLLPELAARPRFGGVTAGGRVRALFVYEPDEDQLVRNFLDREPAAGEQRGRARVSRLFGLWLRDEAIGHGLPALPARPWDTAVDRALAALG